MALVYTDPKNYKDIADSIRNGLGSNITMKPNEMSGQIDKISLDKKHYDELLGDYRNIILPDSTVTIPISMFEGRQTLTAIRIPPSANRLQANSFKNCTRLRSIVLQNITQLGSSDTFSGCSNLAAVFFKKIPNNIPASTFANTTKLKKIYVPWSLGQIDGAPWGAQSATIIYNTDYFTTKIRFHIDDVVYYDVPIGMTWWELINSEYNTDGVFEIDETKSNVTKYAVKWRGQRIIYDSYTVCTYADEAIIPDKQYYTI